MTLNTIRRTLAQKRYERAWKRGDLEAILAPYTLKK